MTDLLPPQLNGFKHHVYLAGPMSGIKGFNFSEFLRIEEAIEKHYNWRVFSPAAYEIEHGIVLWPDILHLDGSKEDLAAMSFDKNTALMRDMGAIADARFGTVLMAGWEGSGGARLEALATLWVGKRLYVVDELGGFSIESLSSDEAYEQIYAWHNAQG